MAAMKSVPTRMVVLLVIHVFSHGLILLHAKNLLLWVTSSYHVIQVSVINASNGNEIGFPMTIEPGHPQYYHVSSTFIHKVQDEKTVDPPYMVCVTFKNKVKLLVKIMAGKRVPDEFLDHHDYIITAFKVSHLQLEHGFGGGSFLSQMSAWSFVCTLQQDLSISSTELSVLSSSSSSTELSSSVKLSPKKLCLNVGTKWSPVPHDEALELRVMNEMGTSALLKNSWSAYLKYLLQFYMDRSIRLAGIEMKDLSVRLETDQYVVSEPQVFLKAAQYWTFQISDNMKDFVKGPQGIFVAVRDGTAECLLGTTAPTLLSYFFIHHIQEEEDVRKVDIMLNEIGIYWRILGNQRILVQTQLSDGKITWSPKAYRSTLLCVWGFTKYANMGSVFNVCNMHDNNQPTPPRGQGFWWQP